MAGKRKTEHSCELCRTLGDLVKELDPDSYRYGPEFVVGHALRTALDKHRRRVGKGEERTGR